MTKRKNLGYTENIRARQFCCMNCGDIFPEENRYHGSMGGDFCSERCYEDYLEDLIEEV